MYITYDGILEPLGQSQVLQYLKGLAPGRTIFLVSYEKPRDLKNVGRRQDTAAAIRKAGIAWVPLRYHRRPKALATAYDIIRGLCVGVYLGVRYNLRIIHARSYVPAVIALVLKDLVNCRFIFDMRGFWADERLESGDWHVDSPMYRLSKWFERKFLTSADAVVSLTNSAVAEMKRFDYLAGRSVNFSVIPTCTNLTLFRPHERNGKEVTGQGRVFVLGYIGCASTRYAFDVALESFKMIRSGRGDARMLIVNREEHDYIRSMLAEKGILPEWFELASVEFERVADQMGRMDAGVFFTRPEFSKKAMAPTKLGELLGCGIPCLTNAGLGDVDSILESERVGVVIRNFSREELSRGTRALLVLAGQADIRERCRAAAIRYFSLDQGIRAYARLYQDLCGQAVVVAEGPNEGSGL